MRRWYAVVLTVFGILGFALPGFAQNTVKVGVLAPLSGFAAADGKSISTAIEIARDEVNAAGGLLGKKVELVVYDDKADPKEAVNFARRLVELDKVAFVIDASYSGAAVAAAPVVNDAGVPFIAAYAVAPEVTKGKPFVFRMGLLGPVQGRVGAVLAQHLKATKVAMLTIQNDFGKALAEGFQEQAKKLGLQIVFSETYPMQNPNFTPLIVRLKESKADVLYASGYYAQASNLVRQARAAGLTIPIIGQEGYDSPKFIELGGKDVEGVYITTTLDRDSDNPDVKKFLAAYKAKAGIDADMVGASGYAAFYVMADAVKKAGSLDGKAIVAAIRAMRDVQTVVGKVSMWDANGDPVKTATVQVVKDGAFHRYMNVTDMDVLKP